MDGATTPKGTPVTLLLILAAWAGVSVPTAVLIGRAIRLADQAEVDQ